MSNRQSKQVIIFVNITSSLNTRRSNQTKFHTCILMSSICTDISCRVFLQQFNRQACHEPGGPNIITKVAWIKRSTLYIFLKISQKTKYVRYVCTVGPDRRALVNNDYYRVKLKLSTSRVDCGFKVVLRELSLLRHRAAYIFIYD